VPFQVREILSEIQDKEVIAKVRLSDGSAKWAEIHWFEAHGIGKKHIKIKYIIGDKL
jgi:hypothetical protein|tara:strand:+ start:361 stop:531 length:171 start_codon:yes stop_codon:yes gene_type:complete